MNVFLVLGMWMWRQRTKYSTADVAMPVKAERSNRFPRHAGSIFANKIRILLSSAS